MSIFHLAIPTHDLNAAKNFYIKAFCATVGREYPGYVIFNFFGHQLVTHLSPDKVENEVAMYPRHYGIIVGNRDQFDRIYAACKQAEVSFYEELFERFQNKKGWHFSFFVSDPSNNLIELKYYVDQNDIFS